MKNHKSKITRAAICAAALMFLNGCFLYMPHNRMTVDTTGSDVPFTVVGLTGTGAEFHCERPGFLGIPFWDPIFTINLTGKIVTKDDREIGVNGSSQVIPADCWQDNSAANDPNRKYRVRMYIGDPTAAGAPLWGTLKKSGLRCLEDKPGVGTGFLGTELSTPNDCLRYDNNNERISTFQVFAKDL